MPAWDAEISRNTSCFFALVLALFSTETLHAQDAPSEHQASQTPSFLNDVEPIFTRLGCNQGACHGKGTGQNGFRLSLRGYAPELDHPYITREFSGRRINVTLPEESL